MAIKSRQEVQTGVFKHSKKNFFVSTLKNLPISSVGFSLAKKNVNKQKCCDEI
jgi:hypothetical protein